ncbi:MAG: hypothetical protein ACOY3E_11095 [Pseudomonadota bacterium]
MPLRTFIAELKRRRVFRVATVYAVVGFGIIQIANNIFPPLDLPAWTTRLVILLVLLGFPIALVLAWALELTPEGLRFTTQLDQRDNRPAPSAHWGWKRHVVAYVMVALLGAGFAILGYRWWVPAPTLANTTKSTSGLPARQSVAVLPFVVMGSDANKSQFADGLTEEIINALAQLPELLVTARTSAFYFKGRQIAIPEIGRTLGVDHVVEGSVRHVEDRVRVTVQLIRAADGFHLWSQNYDRPLTDLLAVQDDIATHIASALGVLLNEQKLTLMKEAGSDNLDAFSAYQRGADLYNEAHRDLTTRNLVLAKANAALDEALALEPNLFAAHVLHSDLYAHLLLDRAAGMQIDLELQPILPEADVRLKTDLDAAYRYARTNAQIPVADYMRRFLSNDWRGLRQAIDQVLTTGACVPALYVNRSIVFGRATDNVNDLQRRIACDPLNEDLLTGLHEAMLWAGDARGALETITDVEQRLGRHHWLEEGKLLASLALADFAGAELALNSANMSEAERQLHRIRLLAVREDATATQAAQVWLRTFGPNDASALLFHAWLGEYDAANRVAGLIDSRPLGPTLLISQTLACYCGAPFELTATPNLARQLSDAELPWPPRTVLRFPAKYW